MKTFLEIATKNKIFRCTRTTLSQEYPIYFSNKYFIRFLSFLFIFFNTEAELMDAN